MSQCCTDGVKLRVVTRPISSLFILYTTSDDDDDDDDESLTNQNYFSLAYKLRLPGRVKARICKLITFASKPASQ